MIIAVTGREGQVVTSLVERARNWRDVEIVALGRPLLNLADPAGVASAIGQVRPDVVISAAAYTAVDKAEQDADMAHLVNVRGAGAVAAAAHALGLPVIHLSTDYVFDGSKPTPYVETDPVQPLGVYGETKLAGEQNVMAAHPGAVICRTAWVYSPFGNNFVKTMLKLAATRDELSVVTDQIGNPTSALDIADALLAIASRLATDPDGASRGVFHLTGTGEGSWADLAREIFAVSSQVGGPVAQVRSIATVDYPTPAARPANSRLDCSKLSLAYDISLPDWRESTRVVVERLVQAQQDHAA